MIVKRVIIVDDEPAARANLRAVIDKFKQLKVIAEVGDGKTAIKEIQTLQPDIVFLDIEMPEVNGFDVAKATEHLNYQLVFATAYDQYALDAFDTKAIDYLLKPVRPSLVEKCINKILEQEKWAIEGLTVQPAQSEQLVLSEACATRILETEQISYIEGIGRYRRIHLSTQGKAAHNVETIICDTTLDEFINQLPSKSFLRVHRSYIVNAQHIVNISVKSRRHFVSLKAVELEIPVSRSQYSALKSWFQR